MTFFIIANVAMLNSPTLSDELKLQLIKDLGVTHNIADFLGRKDDIIEALGKSDNSKGYFFHFLSMMKKDIDTFEALDQNKKKDLNEKLKLFSRDHGYSSKNPIDQNSLRIVMFCRDEFYSTFGQCSYVDLVASSNILLLKISSFPKNDFSEDIKTEITRFERSSWKNSPLLSSLYLIQCSNCRNIKDYKLMLESSEKAKEMRELITKNKSDLIYIGPISYKCQALVGLKKYQDVIELYRNVPSELLETTDRGYFSSVARIISALASSYAEIGKIELACVYQELALSKMYQCFSERGHPAVEEQAIRLRDFLNKKTDFLNMRSIEARFNLMPLPKQLLEK